MSNDSDNVGAVPLLSSLGIIIPLTTNPANTIIDVIAPIITKAVRDVWFRVVLPIPILDVPYGRCITMNIIINLAQFR